ncbi:amidase domain-containing protein [Streptantibioticus rubrisoli]|uniref:Amidase domain-containing protein n=1 Tax=Streptantibioticus rubrisoli TaxID=1387313 RepID=A0ABT1PG58_9ACTN|nr:amidase domain-containing protein [Streptantibioticus rubrisoli]MCQ4044367.1 amidase domain-containing protein [Streptantibioticus rubrisoli]
MRPKSDWLLGIHGDNAWGRSDDPSLLPDSWAASLSYSRTWAYADGLQGFLLNNGGKEVPPSQAQPGDIIFYDQDGPRDGVQHGEAHHAAVITSVTPDGDIKYTQHNADYKNVSLDGHLPSFVESKGAQRIRIVRPMPNWY